MCHRLHRSAVRAQGRFHHVLAVAGRAQPKHAQLLSAVAICLLKGQKAVANRFDGVAVVVGVEGVEHVAACIEQRDLRRGRPDVDADVGIDARASGRACQLARFQTVPLLECGALLVGGEQRLGSACVGAPALLLKLSQRRLGGVKRDAIRIIAAHRRAHCYDGFGVVGHDDLVGGKVEPLGEHAHEGGVVGERPAFENDGRCEGKSLRQAAHRLLRDGVECRKGQVGRRGALDAQRLDVGLGEHSAASRDIVDALALRGQRLKPAVLAAEQLRDLVDESAGAPGAAAVHTHIAGNRFPALGAAAEKHHLRVLPAQLDGAARLRVQSRDGRGVRHHLLHVAHLQGLRHRYRSRSAYGKRRTLDARFPAARFKQISRRACQAGVVASIVPEHHLVTAPVDCGDLRRGRPDV